MSVPYDSAQDFTAATGRAAPVRIACRARVCILVISFTKNFAGRSMSPVCRCLRAFGTVEFY